MQMTVELTKIIKFLDLSLLLHVRPKLSITHETGYGKTTTESSINMCALPLTRQQI